MKAAIVNYNTPELTAAAIMSLRKHTPCDVIVFDNSDRRPMPPMEGVDIIDNTLGQVIDFPRWLDGFPNKLPSDDNNYGSAKHCKSVDILLDLVPEGFLLLDSDVLVMRDVSALHDRRFAWAGEVQNHRSRFGTAKRILPMLCYINAPMLMEYGIRYFDGSRMFALTDRKPYAAYDTGASFWEACEELRLPYRGVRINEYVIHLGHGSWRRCDHSEWLEQHKELWKL